MSPSAGGSRGRPCAAIVHAREPQPRAAAFEPDAGVGQFRDAVVGEGAAGQRGVHAVVVVAEHGEPPSGARIWPRTATPGST